MDLQIILKQGLGEIHFGCTPEVVRAQFGEPDEVEELEDDEMETFTEDEMLEAIQSLPEGYKMVFNLYVFEDYKHKEIAEMLNISVNTSKSQLSKARLFLQKKLNKKTAEYREWTFGYFLNFFAKDCID